MQGAIAKVCMVVAAAILNHPLLNPQENTSTLLEQDTELLTRMKEHEEKLEREHERLEKEFSQLASKQEETHSEDVYIWYIWNVLNLVIFIGIYRVRSTEIGIQSAEDEDALLDCGAISSKTLVLDKAVLRRFRDKCMYTSAHEHWRVREFVEGFADDLLESLRSVHDTEVDMEVGDFFGVGSMFESWKVSKPLMCDLIVTLSPPEPYSFQFELWCSHSKDIPPDMQGCGKIKVSRPIECTERCLCGSANPGEDVLCLLHSYNDGLRMDRSPSQLLCSKNSSYLAKDQVMKWFQISITKAWGRISHKYDFELTFRNLDAAGALKIRFQSGKVVVMNIIPAIQLQDTYAYFVSYFPSDTNSSSDAYWALSFAVYEKNLLKNLAKGLPEKSCHLNCLQILSFLHNKQTGLTGKSGLTTYHLKTALLHLLLTKSPPDWTHESLEKRLRDVLGLLQRSLQEKRLNHILVGNRQVPADIQVPEIFCMSEPINLFRPLVVQRQLYANTVRHLQEMIMNASMLLQEYSSPLVNGLDHHGPC